MLNLPPSTRIFICSQPIDMRIAFDGLSGMVTNHFGANPLCGHLFVFFSRRRDRMKILFWDLDGYVLYYKRLEKGSFSWLSDFDLGPDKEILSSEFALVLAGVNPSEIKRPRRLRIPQGSALYTV